MNGQTETQNRLTWAFSIIGSAILMLAQYIQNGGRPDLEKRLGGQWLLVVGVGMLVYAALGVSPLADYALALEDAGFIALVGLGLIGKNTIDDTKALEAKKQAKLTMGKYG